MSQEQILDALQFIDDDMIESVNVLRKYPERHRFLWLNYVAVAACVVLAIFGGLRFFDGNAPMQEGSDSNGGTSNTNEMQNDVENIFGSEENKNYYTDQNTQNDNSSFRDEAGDSTGATSNGSMGSSPNSSTGDVCFAATVYMEITEISDNSFKGKVLKRAVVGNKIHFEENQIVTVIYSKSTNENLHTLLIEDLSVGEKVHVFYGRIEDDTIYTPRIEYELF